jgi:RHS repeat-associated protein
LVTISDKKIGVDNNSDGTVDYYEADVISAQDYYPGGMLMPGRTFSSSSYRYGFNGKEQDPEVKGSGTQYDYGFRIYDPRLGRFLSVDPLTRGYPMLTPYQFASNRPIDGIDLDGLEYIVFHVKITKDANGKPQFSKTIARDFRGMTSEQTMAYHGLSAERFYKHFSESFGKEGRGFKWIYFDENNKQIGEPVWQMKQGWFGPTNLANSGYYSGSGSITKYGPGTSEGDYKELDNDYDFGYAPMGKADEISKEHDMIQEFSINKPQGWLEDTRTLMSDELLMDRVTQALDNKSWNSDEDYTRLKRMKSFFEKVIEYKKWKVGEMDKKGYDKDKAENQRKIILKDWKGGSWWTRKVLKMSGGGASEKDRNTVKPEAKKTP